MMRVGRRPGFVVGALLGVAGGILAAAGMWMGALLVLSLGTLLVGAYQSFAQFYRFAASEVATPDLRPRAISLLLAGGIVAAILGPMLGRVGRALIGPDYLGCSRLRHRINGASKTDRLAKDAPAFVADRSAIPPLLVCNRVDHVRANIAGKTAAESNKDAAKEIAALWEAVKRIAR